MEEIQIETHPEIINLRTSIAAVRHQYNAAIIQRQFGGPPESRTERERKSVAQKDRIASGRTMLSALMGVIITFVNAVIVSVAVMAFIKQ